MKQKRNDSYPIIRISAAHSEEGLTLLMCLLDSLLVGSPNKGRSIHITLDLNGNTGSVTAVTSVHSLVLGKDLKLKVKLTTSE